jgi:hypothetical protein
MPRKPRVSKFSELENSEAVYDEIAKFIRYLASRYAGSYQILMEYDELIAELNLEFVKGIQAYGNRPMGELKAILRRMMDNRIAELRYRYYRTHRRAEVEIISLEMEVGGGDVSHISQLVQTNTDEGTPVEELIEGNPDSSYLYDSKERVAATRALLSPNTVKVFDAIVYGNKQLAAVMHLSCQRSAVIFKSANVKLKPWHVADALCMEEREVKAAFREIKQAYAEVLNG